ncbi:hypothetical protein HPB48_009660 [Haemaphysalis longicornis]|uniref:DDE-1 domain-containing protein n=1 Tax=Haemaphysalis longicornis TaxID=44386 RepID=A0A9J6FC05_HAELO|nr:hypothetical protein HPB48_009660 [Haemaphysalis longicornis]
MRQSFIVAKKVEVVGWHRKAGSNECQGNGKFKRSLNSGRPVFSEEIDDGLFEFLQEERAAGKAVTRKLASEAKLGNFNASSQYLSRWKKRFNASLRAVTNDSQKLPIDHAEAVSAFQRTVGTLHLQHDYSDFSIANMDQTMVQMDQPASRTNNVAGDASIRIANTGCSRCGFTVALCATAAGIKLPAFIILKEPTGRIPPMVLFALSVPDDVQRLLILNQAPIHKTDAARKALASKDTNVVLVPGGCTSIVQPADVSWMKPFKDSLRETWASFIRAGAVTPKGNLKKPSRQDVVNFVSKAWAAGSEEVVARSFKRCGISTMDQKTELNERLASAIPPSAALPTTSNSMHEEVVDLLFDSESDCSFDSFDGE